MEKRKRIDPRIDEYKSFYDHDWAKRMSALTKDTLIDEIAFDLGIAWKSAANTHVLPWLMMETLKNFATGFAEAHDPLSYNWLNLASDRIAQGMGQDLRLMQHQRIRSILQHLFEEAKSAFEAMPLGIDFDGYWRDITQFTEFQLSLWGSQRIIYGAVYYAYEDFLLRAFKKVTGQTSYRIQDKFSKDFADSFGVSTRDFCWSDPKVIVARLVRHALVHNGGRVTIDLSAHNLPIEVEDGELQIMAPDTKAVYDLLKVRALRLAEEVASNDERARRDADCPPA